MPVELTLWGKLEHQTIAVNKLKSCGFYLTGGTKVSLQIKCKLASPLCPCIYIVKLNSNVVCV